MRVLTGLTAPDPEGGSASHARVAQSLPFPCFPITVFDTRRARFMINQKAMNQQPRNPFNRCNHVTYLTAFGDVPKIVEICGSPDVNRTGFTLMNKQQTRRTKWLNIREMQSRPMERIIV